MKTSRDRRSSSGQASRWRGRVDDVLDGVQEDRPVAADVDEPLDAQEVLPARVEQHRQPDPEAEPVERLVDDERDRADVALVAVPVLVASALAGSSARVRPRRRCEEPRRLDVPERRLDDVGGWVQPRELGRHGGGAARSVFVTTSDVRDRRLLDRLRAAEPVHRVDRRDDGLELDVVAQQRLGERASRRSASGRRARSSRRRRGGTAGSRPRRDGRAASRSSSARSPRSVQQTQPDASSTVRSSTWRTR